MLVVLFLFVSSWVFYKVPLFSILIHVYIIIFIDIDL